MDLKLEEKRVLISGSRSMLGLATSKQLLLEGATVCINGRNEKRLDSALAEFSRFKRVFAYQADITREDNCADKVSFVNEKMGGDILVINRNCPPPGTFEKLESYQWGLAIERSFLIHVYLIKYALPFLKVSSTPRVLTVPSFTAKQPLENLILSNSIRAVTLGLTKSLSKKFGEINIRVNSILPGWTLTQRVNDLINDSVSLNNSSFEKEISNITDKIPLFRMALPEEFGKVAAYIVSPAASYIKGVLLNVDSGLYNGLQ